jgi:uncharacterized protein (TIGR00299 family) protein
MNADPSTTTGTTTTGTTTGFRELAAVTDGKKLPKTGRSAWFNCHAGVAGDMTLAALIDAGADPDEVADAIAGLGVDGYAMFFERVQRCGVGATWANIVTHDALPAHEHHEHDDPHHDPHHDPHDGDGRVQHAPHRPAREIFALLDAADLADRVRARARATFKRLAEVEGAIHGIDPLDVELHEVGALDSIIDVVGVCAALESLGIDHVACSSIGLGSGIVQTAHGQLPHPAPATMALLTEARAATHGLDTSLETCTPTGAALMVTLADSFGPGPAGTAVSVGYGAGTADPPNRANVVQVVIADVTTTSGATEGGGAPVIQLDANVDDVTGEVLAHTIQQLLAAGAHDAWATPIVMKKGRPSHMVSALCDPARRDALRDVLVAETGTLGVRATESVRWPQVRTMSTVEVDGHTIGVKLAEHRIKVEFDDAARAAAALGIPVRIVIERAVAVAAQR